MKLHLHLLAAAALVTLPACEQQSGSNRTDGVKDAIGARPYEGIRDAGEEIGADVREVGRDLKDAVGGN